MKHRPSRPKADEDYLDYPMQFGVGSLHTLSETHPDVKRVAKLKKRRQPIGFHIPKVSRCRT